MLLRRLGNKQKIAKEIIKCFPEHELYVEPFFGAGGLFFNKPLAKYNYLNDIDNDVYNLFMQVKFNHQKLYEFVETVPLHVSVFKYFKKLQTDDLLMSAARFCVLSNYSLYGTADCLKFTRGNNDKKILLNSIIKTYEFLCKSSNIIFHNTDFRIFIRNLQIRTERPDKHKTFIYADPPYLGTTNNYSNSFSEQDSVDLFNILDYTGCNYAVSEFDNPFIIEQASERNLTVIKLKNRRNLSNRRNEILVTNYNPNTELF